MSIFALIVVVLVAWLVVGGCLGSFVGEMLRHSRERSERASWR